MPDSQAAIRILHLEDNPRDAAMVADLLDVEGLCGEITHVTHRKPFEEALEQSRFDLILCDFNLLDFDGLAALKLAKGKYPETPVIIVSGAIDSEDAVACLRAGATDYLLKQRLERLPSAVLRAQEEVKVQKLRRAAETRLSETEERFRQLADHSSEGFWFVELDPQVTIYVSPGVERICGVPAERYYQDANTWMLAIHPDDRPHVGKAWAACVQGEAPRFDAQYRVIRPDGSMRWVLDSGTPMCDETGKVVRVSGVFTDITERTQAEARLSDSEERFRQLAENVRDVFWLTDLAKTQIFYISPAYEAIWGRTCASLQASPRQWVEDIHPEDRERVIDEAFNKQTSGVYDEQFRIVRPDGAIRWIHARAFPVQDQSGKIYRIAGVARDVTDSRMAAAALQDERDRLRQILDAQFGFITELSLDGTVVEVNQMPLTLMGLSREEVLGRPFAEIGWLEPGGEALVLAGIRAAGLGETVRDDVSACFPGLGRRDVDAIFSPLRNAAGEVISVLGFGVDITDRKLAEQVVRESEEKFSIMFGSAPFAICLSTLLDGVLHEVNRAWLDLCGFTRKDEVLGKTSVELGLFPDEKPRNSLLDNLLRHGSIQNAEVMIRSTDGTRRSLLVNIDPVTIGGRQFALAMMADITESKQAEEALRAARAREAEHATMLASVRDAVVARDLDQRIHYWNAGAERLYGWTAQEVMGRRADEVLFADPDPPQREVELLRTGEWHGEHLHRTKEGREIIVESLRSLLVDEEGQPSGVLAINTDITERIRARAALEESQNAFRSLAGVAPAGIFRADEAGRCVFVNQHWSLLTGLSEEQALGEDWSIAIHPDDSERVMREWNEAARLRVPFHSEYRFQRPDGSVNWVMGQAVELKHPEGWGLGHVLTVVDITDQKQTEAVLRVLSTEVAGLTDEAFLQSIVRRLAELVGVEFGFVGRLGGEGEDCIQTLALWAGDQFAPNILYNLEGTPCENLGDKEPCIHASGVRQQFPRDTMLAKMGIESFASIPLHDASGKPLGQLGVMSRQPLRDPAQVAATLKFFAVRTAWEIERMRISRRFTDLFEFAPDAILITNREGIITLANRQAESMFGWTRDELVGRPVETLMPEENRHGHGALRERYLHGGAPRPMGGGRSNLRAARKDGSIFPVDISLSPLDTEDGMMVAAAVRDISERVHAETLVLKSLHEKETLLKEIHHRVKNNLQVISSLLSMQADTVEDPGARNLLQESQHRVRAMAMIHEKLYQSDSLAKVDFGDYVSQLTTFLHHNYATSAPVHLVVDADEDVSLNIDTAIPAGLILNELVTNAFKHAFKDGKPHVLEVLLKKSDGGCSLTVADDGPGLPAGFVIAKPESLGMELVDALTAQLKARLMVENQGGTRFRLDFNELIYAARS